MGFFLNIYKYIYTYIKSASNCATNYNSDLVTKGRTNFIFSKGKTVMVGNLILDILHVRLHRLVLFGEYDGYERPVVKEKRCFVYLACTFLLLIYNHVPCVRGGSSL